jgi:ABC-2 type transport system ATP-binding protein
MFDQKDLSLLKEDQKSVGGQAVPLALEAKGLSMRFGRSDVLKQVDLRVPEGAVYALLGRNGVGKSTFLQLALGLLRPTEGAVRILGLDPQKDGTQLRQRIGYIPERLPLYNWMTVSEMLGFTAAPYKRWSQDEEARLIAKFRLPREKKISELSRGNLALLALVMAMAHDPELVLLDECTSGMDAIFRAEFDRTVIETLHEAKRTVIFASHQIRELEFLCDWVGIIHDGSMLLEMPVDDLKAAVKSVRIECAEENGPPLLPAELSRQRLGREWLVTVRNASLVPASIPGARILEVIDLSLEQIFVALLSDVDEQP